MLSRTPAEDCLEVKEYLDAMIDYYKDTHNPLLVERRKTYKDIKIALFGEDIDYGNKGNKDTQTWVC